MIELRAWIRSEKRMIYMPSSPMEGPKGLHAIERALHGLVVKENRADEGQDRWCVSGYNWPKILESEYFCDLMQFTGLCDKNSKKIFQGDIVRFSRYWRDHFGVDNGSVFFFEGSFIYTHGNLVVNAPDLCGISKEIEVIGDIYSNPELCNV